MNLVNVQTLAELLFCFVVLEGAGRKWGLRVGLFEAGGCVV